MNECVAADQGRHMHQYRLSGALQIFFYKLCRLLHEAPVVVIFVFDGPERPSFKRGKEINTKTTPEWTSPCKAIIEAFGFYWHEVSSLHLRLLMTMYQCSRLFITDIRHLARLRLSSPLSTTGMRLILF